MTTPGMVFHRANVMHNFRDVFVLSAEVETDVPKGCLKWLKLGIGKGSGNVEATLAIGLDHSSEGSSHGGNLMVQERFNSPKVKAVGDSDEEQKFIDKH